MRLCRRRRCRRVALPTNVPPSGSLASTILPPANAIPPQEDQMRKHADVGRDPSGGKCECGWVGHFNAAAFPALPPHTDEGCRGAAHIGSLPLVLA